MLCSVTKAQDRIPQELRENAVKIFNPFVDVYKPKLRHPIYLTNVEARMPSGPVKGLKTIDLNSKSYSIESYGKVGS